MSIQRKAIWKQILMALLVIVVWSMVSFYSHGLPIDPLMSDSGMREPFSTRSGVIKTMWELYDFEMSVTDPVGSKRDLGRTAMDDLAEPGMGNKNKIVLGHLLKMGEAMNGTTTWVLYDRLVEVYVPHVMYFHPGSMMMQGEDGMIGQAPLQQLLIGGGTGSGSNGGGGGGIGGRASFDLPEGEPEGDGGGFTPVPEPSAFVLLALGGAVMLGRQKLRGHDKE